MWVSSGCSRGSKARAPKRLLKKLSGCRAAIRYAESLVALAEYAAWIEEGFFSE